MTPLNSEKYNIAWFKLAEFVVRGEKEKALGIYRLLSHSINDLAFSCQLEGDLLLSFNDEKAIEIYNRAAFLYQKEGKLQQAIGIYEHLVLLKPEIAEYLNKLISLYQKIDNDSKKIKTAYALIDLHINQKKIDEIEPIFDQSVLNEAEIIILYEYLIFKLIEYPKYYNQELFYLYLNKYLDYIKNDINISKFMVKVSEIDSKIYNYALDYIKQN